MREPNIPNTTENDYNFFTFHKIATALRYGDIGCMNTKQVWEWFFVHNLHASKDEWSFVGYPMKTMLLPGEIHVRISQWFVAFVRRDPQVVNIASNEIVCYLCANFFFVFCRWIFNSFVMYWNCVFAFPAAHHQTPIVPSHHRTGGIWIQFNELQREWIYRWHKFPMSIGIPLVSPSRCHLQHDRCGRQMKRMKKKEHVIDTADNQCNIHSWLFLFS